MLVGSVLSNRNVYIYSLSIFLVILHKCIQLTKDSMKQNKENIHRSCVGWNNIYNCLTNKLNRNKGNLKKPQ